MPKQLCTWLRSRSAACAGRARARSSRRAQRWARARRTRSSSLLWQLPMRDLLGLLRKHPDLYRSACRQAVPSVHFDWLAIVNKARGRPARGPAAPAASGSGHSLLFSIRPRKPL